MEPDGARAAEAAVGHALQGLGGREPAGLLLFASNHHRDPRALLRVARDKTNDAPMAGCLAAGVIGPQGEIEDGPGVVALAVPKEPGVALSTFFCAKGVPLAPRPPEMLPGLALVFADAGAGVPEPIGTQVASALPHFRVAGGLAVGNGPRAPAYRWRDDELSSHGAVGFALSTGGPVAVGVAQACLPLGDAHTVTAAEGNMLHELDGKAAFGLLASKTRALLEDPVALCQNVLLAIGPESTSDPVPGEYVLRGIVGFEPVTGSVAVSEPIATGTRVRMVLKDARAGRENLRAMLGRVRETLNGRPPKLGVYFNCAGRGAGLYGCADHDAAVITSELGEFPLVGLFGAGELGPVHDRTILHLYSGVLAVIA